MIAFFVGTAAELVKLAPIIAKIRARGAPSLVVASGQNDLGGSPLWELAGGRGADLVLGGPPARATAAGLVRWMLGRAATGALTLARALPRDRRGVTGVVHGDTVSSLLGAALFTALSVPVHHVEAGLRSFRWREPFPEELCRVLVSRAAAVAYCPNEWAAAHLRRPALRKLVTGGNTLYDALHAALARPPDDAARALLGALPPTYFVLVVHRQENLVGAGFLTRVIEAVRALPDRPPCVVVLHALTRNALVRAGLLAQLERDPGFILVPRQPYVTFTRVLERAAFLVTDGGSNQEEAHYLGKPCLLLRRVTERIEGLGENVLLSPEPLAALPGFVRGYERWARPPVTLARSPSDVIADDLAPG